MQCLLLLTWHCTSKISVGEYPPLLVLLDGVLLPLHLGIIERCGDGLGVLHAKPVHHPLYVAFLIE